MVAGKNGSERIGKGAWYMSHYLKGSCCCRQTDAIECVAFRLHLPVESIDQDDGCECFCHRRYDDYDEDYDPTEPA